MIFVLGIQHSAGEVFVNIPKSKKSQESETFLVPSMSDKGYSTYSTVSSF